MLSRIHQVSTHSNTVASNRDSTVSVEDKSLFSHVQAKFVAKRILPF